MTTPSTQIKIALGADFLAAFSRLPKKQQKKVREFLDKFTQNPETASLNYEKIQGARDPHLRSVRVDQNYRGVILKPQQGNVFVLLWVDKHDAAYEWACQRTCGIHPMTGAVQVVLTEQAATASLEATQKEKAEEHEVVEAKAPPALFAEHSDEDILSLGVPPNLLGHVRAVCTEKQLEEIEAVLPRDAFEGVFLVAAGYSIEEACSELCIQRQTSVDTNDFAAAVERDGSRRQFVVITDAAEMENVLSAPLEQWRVFLHPSQRRLVEMSANGPVRVLGSAGTGKTVVAMHRAVWLVRNACAPGQRVLFTTFTRNLAADIAANLKKLCSREEWERIEVVNLDAWTRRFLDKQGFSLQLAYEDALREDMWQKALSLLPSDTPFPQAFIKSEWDNVIQAHGIDDEAAYMTVSRVGRSRRFARKDRHLLWPVFGEYRALLSEHGLCEPADAFRSAARLIQERGITFPYRSAVVDEAQDFGNEAFRLLRAVVPSDPGDLFIAGDAHQRIYGHQVVLSRCGIDIRGRGRKLRINYRTTEEVKNWASGILKGLTFDDLDAGFDDAEGIRSLVHGEPPIVETCSSETAAWESAASHIKQLLRTHETKPEGICVVARTHRELDECQKYLSQVCPIVHRVEPGKADDGSAHGLRIATIHRVKGLEFDHVIIVEPHEHPGAATQNEEDVRRNRILFYVAATRVRRSLFVCRIELCK
jgi:mRNA-degrading endonuclease RelE of RelBE toxin-antitoxin system